MTPAFYYLQHINCYHCLAYCFRPVEGQGWNILSHISDNNPKLEKHFSKDYWFSSMHCMPIRLLNFVSLSVGGTFRGGLLQPTKFPILPCPWHLLLFGTYLAMLLNLCSFLPSGFPCMYNLIYSEQINSSKWSDWLLPQWNKLTVFTQWVRNMTAYTNCDKGKKTSELYAFFSKLSLFLHFRTFENVSIYVFLLPWTGLRRLAKPFGGISILTDIQILRFMISK